jgi:hypothetical protein
MELSIDNNGILTIKINLKQKGQLSKSEKSKTIASSEGNIHLSGKHKNVTLSLNCYKPVNEKE